MSNGDVPIRAASAKPEIEGAFLESFCALVLRLFHMQQQEAAEGPQRQPALRDIHHSGSDHQIDIHRLQPPHQLFKPLCAKTFCARQCDGVGAALSHRGHGVRLVSENRDLLGR